MTTPPSASALETLFSSCFFSRYFTQLIGGADEPFYQAARAVQPAVIYYRHDYVSSALHEIAHWCIAGEKRRQQDDYGYWYAEDGRSREQQAVFEAVEIKPQALETLFSQACGQPFRVSVDNLALPDYDSGDFAQKVTLQAQRYEAEGLPTRAAVWLSALRHSYSASTVVS